MVCPKCGDKSHVAKRVTHEVLGIVDSDALAQEYSPLALSIFIDVPLSLLPDPLPPSDAELIRGIQSHLDNAEAVQSWLLLRFAASPTAWRLRRNGLWGVPHQMVLQEFAPDGTPVDVAKDREEHVLDADGVALRLILRQMTAGSEEFVLGF